MWIPTCAALAIALAIRVAVDATSESWWPDIAFYATTLTVVCGAVLALLRRLGPWMRAEDLAWLSTAAQRFKVPAASAGAIALVLSADLASAVWLRAPEVSAVSVVRAACTRISSGAARVTVDSAVSEGRMCFIATAARGANIPRWRVPIDRVGRQLSMGDSGTLEMRSHPSVIFGPLTYTVVPSVR